MFRGAFITIALVLAVNLQIAPARTAAQPPQSEAPSADDEQSNLVVARVAGIPITEQEVLSAIDDLASQQQMSLEQLKHRNTLLFEGALKNLITIAILKNEVRRQNVTVDKARIDAQVQQFAKRFPSQEEFLKAIKDQGITEAELRKNIEESLSMQAVIDQAVGDISVTTDEEIQKFYAENPDKFQISEQVRASHILLRVDPNSTPEQKAEIRKKLESILADIQARKCTFAEAAVQYSQDSTNSAKGGDLGLFSRGRMVKPFEDAAFSAKPGEISQIVATQFGYHLIQVTERRPARTASLEEAKTAIKEYLDKRSKSKATQEYVKKLNDKTAVDIFITREEFAKRHPAQ
jgi:peptidyl-prolyl cis-trans isomerase C